MATQQYTAQYSVGGSVWTSLSNLQSVTINIGNQEQLQQIKASTAQLRFRYPTGYASPITQLVPSTFVRIVNTTPSSGNYTIYCGRIANVSAEYGIPYSGGVGVSDYLDIDLEGTFAEMGRLQANGYVMSAGTIANQLTASTAYGALASWDSTTTQNIAGTTIDGTWGDWVSQLALTTNARLVDGSEPNMVNGVYTLRSPFADKIATVNFSDTTNNATNQVYSDITFESLADNYYTQVIVTPESYAEQVVPAGSTTGRSYQVNTLNASEADALDFANYLLSNYNTQQLTISSITCMGEAQNSFQLDKIAANNFYNLVGYYINVVFRGTTYPCVVEGVTMSATPSSSRFTYYLSGGSLNNFLRLDNATYGTLDNNRLGFGY
jgi:hypothetical protein